MTDTASETPVGKGWRKPSSGVGSRIFEPSRIMLAGIVVVLLAAATMGGGTHSGYLADTVVQVAALGLLFRALATRPESRPWVSASTIFCMLVLAVPLVQVLPLGFGKLLPSGGTRALATISVDPSATWNALLAMVPGIAVFLSVRDLGLRHRRTITVVLVACALLNAVLGLAQLAQGPASPLRFFAETNQSDAVGFFANRNHLGALLFATAPFVVAWFKNASQAFWLARDEKRLQSEIMLPLILTLGTLLIYIATLAATRSRAAVILMMIGLGLSSFIVMSGGTQTSSTFTRRLWLTVVAVSILFAAQLTLFRLLDRFNVDVLKDARITFARLTSEAAAANMPFGSGLGTFTSIYSRYETPADAFADIFANRAHNDWLEFWLEGGVFAIVVAGLFLLWLTIRVIAVWMPRKDVLDIDRDAARAASLAVLLLLAHSVVDYPLRTTALDVVFAVACALLITAPFDATLKASGAEDRGRKRSKTRRLAAEEVPHNPPSNRFPSAVPTPHRREQDTDWPDAWRTPTGEADRDTAAGATGDPSARKRSAVDPDNS